MGSHKIVPYFDVGGEHHTILPSSDGRSLNPLLELCSHDIFFGIPFFPGHIILFPFSKSICWHYTFNNNVPRS